MSCSVRSVVLGSAACAALAAGPASAADSAYNILFYGSSYTTPGDPDSGDDPDPLKGDPAYTVPYLDKAAYMQDPLKGDPAYTVPYLVKGIARASGRTAPNVENAAVYGGSLAGHIQLRTGFISNPQDFVESPGFQWNYVVLQESTLIPTNVTDTSLGNVAGNPEAFKANANTLYGLVKSHSPNAKAVLYETWAESPHSTQRLATFYPAPPTYLAKSNQMSAELHQYYGEARDVLGASNATIAHVNDAFKDSNYEDTLYKYGFFGPGSGNDWRHPSPKGALLAGLVIYSSIYQTDASLIPYSQMDSALIQMNPNWPLSAYGIDNAAEWNALTSLADSVAVPEPTSLALLASGVILLGRRRARNRA